MKKKTFGAKCKLKVPSFDYELSYAEQQKIEQLFQDDDVSQINPLAFLKESPQKQQKKSQRLLPPINRNDKSQIAQQQYLQQQNWQDKSLKYSYEIKNLKDKNLDLSSSNILTRNFYQNLSTYNLVPQKIKVKGALVNPHYMDSDKLQMMIHSSIENPLFEPASEYRQSDFTSKEVKASSQFLENGLQSTKQLSKYDVWDDDLPEKEWMDLCRQSKGPHAKSPLYLNKKYHWMPVYVLDYDNLTRKFKIRFDNGIEKKIGRLSLLFFSEDKNKFNERLKLCKHRYAVAEDEMRFFNYVDAQSNLLISNLHPDIKQRILKKALKKKRGESGNQQIILKETNILVEEIERQYNLLMKKCLVLNEMKLSSNNQKFKQMRIRLRNQEIKYSLMGILFSQDQNVKQDIISNLKVAHISAKPEMLKTMLMITKRTYDPDNNQLPFINHKFFNLNLAKKQLPMTAEDFEREQTKKFQQQKQGLNFHWRDYIIQDIDDNIGSTYNLFMQDASSYHDSERCKMLKTIDFVINSYLRKIMHENVRLWCEFIRQFTVPEENDPNIWSISDYPLLYLNLVIQETKKKHISKDKKKKKEQQEEIETLMFFTPSKDAIMQLLCKPFDFLIEATESFTILEADIVKYADIRKVLALDLKVEREEMNVIMEGRNTIMRYVEDGFKEPEAIMEQFQKYIFLTERSTHEILKALFGSITKDRDIMEIDKGLVESGLKDYENAKNEVAKLCIDEKQCKFFLVKTPVAKEFLINKARELLERILEKISSVCQTNVQKIETEYSDMQKKITSTPENEQELIKQKDFISKHEEMLQNLDKKILKINQFLQILEKYCFTYDNQAFEQFLFLRDWPATIKEAILSSQRMIANQEQLFMERLENEKEEFQKTLEKLADDFSEIMQYSNYSQYKRVHSDVMALKDKIIESQEKVKSFNQREELFKLQIIEYDELDDLNEKFEPYCKLWETAFWFKENLETWMMDLFNKIQFVPTQKKIDSFYKDTTRLMAKFEEDDPALIVAEDIKKDIEEFRKKLWLIELLSIDAFVKKPQIFWKRLFDECGIKKQPEIENLKLQELIELGLMDKKEIIEQVSKKAAKQWAIETKLNEISDKLKALKFEVVNIPKTSKLVLKGIDDVQQKLDEYLNIVLLMKSSPDVKNVLKKANDLEGKLLLTQDTLDEWIKCQRSWVYLEPIFASDDIKNSLPYEKQNFDSVNTFWVQTMEQYQKDPFISEVSDSDKLKNDFISYNQKLEKIQKKLSEYLETKRKYFSRFYFLSDEQLVYYFSIQQKQIQLEILAQTKDPETVQRHINKCFEAINQLQFDETQCVTAMISPEKEEIKFLKSIDVNEGQKKGNVERWLLEIEEMMRETLKEIMKQSLTDKRKRAEWVLSWPAQIILAVNMVRWTVGAENAFKQLVEEASSMLEYQEQLEEELKGIVEMVRGDLNPLQRVLLGALVTIDVHNKDIIESLHNQKVQSINDFAWIAQLRYYYENIGRKAQQGQTVKTRIINAEQNYGYEYLGNSTRLVITPLTDRCYRTLMNAYHLFYGGAPEGPAGTGKTESVKDLAKAVAMQCVVFNCSDGLNYRAMSKFFKGLASAGAWCCFDEFNRIDLEVLSVIAQQVITIQTAIKEKRKEFFFDDETISLISTCCINITMNPGYAGRSELPDNLKALFRSCAMMVPDYSLISEIFLYSSGFQDARNLARKVVASLRLSSEQLSSQYHYDFGMRAVKAILTAAGDLKRKMAKSSEDIICLRALLDVNLPKFTINDIPLFNSITSDLFPGVEMETRDYGHLLDKLKEQCEQNQLIPSDNFLGKCIQLFDTIMVRHGLMLVGEAFSGKSKVIESLAKAMGKNKEDGMTPVITYKINPKSITLFQLYGLFDQDSKSWSDGVLPIIMRECAELSEENFDKRWIIFDGPVDAVWIENMNTVLDDNKKLCLTTGEIIKLTPFMTMMFEVEDLVYASPATVSRCGMVYLESKNLGWEALLQSYMKEKFPQDSLEKSSEIVMRNMKLMVDCCSAFVRKQGKFPMQIADMQMTATFLKIFHTFIDEFIEHENEKVKVPKEIDDYLINFIVFAIVWSYGGCLEETTRKKFHLFVMDILAGKNIAEEYKLDLLFEHEWKSMPVHTNDQDIYEICYEKNKKLWVNWIQLLPPFKIEKELKYHELIIPTSDSVRNNYFLNLAVDFRMHYLITGPTGTGKTVNIISELTKNYLNTEYTNLCTSLSGQTTANQLQKIIESKVNTKRKKGCYGPEDQKQCIAIFIDDVNMPIKEKYGAQPPIELLRQWMDTSGWYDLESKEPKTLQDIVFIVAMGPPSQGRNSITQRYCRHFNIIYAAPFSDESMVKIFSNILEWYFMNLQKSPSKVITNLKENIVASTIKLFQSIKTSKELLPTPAKSHYIYNLRDISKVFQGISKAKYQALKDDNDFLRLWIHECYRVFSDRLINLSDREFFKSIVKQLLMNTFKRDWAQLVQNEPLLFCTFVPSIYPDGDTSKRPLADIYCELKDFAKLKKCAEEGLENFNNSHSSNRMELVLFMNALEHVIKIHRIITTAYGHALLVGVGGSGRKSLATLACGIADYEQTMVNPKDWIAELQRVMKIAGQEQKETVFIFSDTQVQDEGMIEDICNILNNGEVPNLFQPDEKQKIIEELTEELGNTPAMQGLLTPNQKFGYFLKQCKQNLHMVICMSPVGEAFRKRIRTFPGLVNCTTIDWFLPWPEEALISTAQQNISQIKQLSSEVQEGLVKTCVDMQLTVEKLSKQYFEELRRYFYVTPTSYLELLGTFAVLYYAREKEIQLQITRYETGLQKLEESEVMVEAMRKEVKELQPKLEIKQKENQILLKNLKVKQKEADVQKELCQKEELECTKQREEANALKEECQGELDKVLPILETAKQDLEKVKKDHISFIKSLVTPPPAIWLLMEGVCYVLGVDNHVKWRPKEPGSLEKIQDFWDYSKKFVLNAKLKDQMKSYDEEAIRLIPKNKIEKMKNLIENPNFSDESMSKVSEATKYMATWVRGIYLTYKALLVVDPKRKELAVAEAKLKESEEILQEKKDQLQIVLDNIVQLEDEYNTAKQEKEKLEANLKRCEKQLFRAQKLLEGLGSQKENWHLYVKNYKVEIESVIGDVMMSAGIIAYMGAFPVDYRKQCIKKWEGVLNDVGIKVSQNYSLKNTLSDAISRGIWVNNHKLPNDDFSVDNAIIMMQSKRWPLMIDPQLQANIWIKEREKLSQPALIILKPTQSAANVINILEQAVTYGQPILLENMGESIDQIYEPILNKCLIKKGASWQIQLGDKMVDYHEDFKFYMTTKLSNPHYTPEICVKVTLLNFLVTQEGLTDQMLNNVMKKEESEKFEVSVKNVREYFENKSKQKKTEDHILKLLNESKGEILDDDELIDTLQSSQTEAIELNDKLEKSHRDQQKFELTKNLYQALAKRCANLFFVLMDLAKIEPMYQFSLESFVQVFYKAIQQTVAPATGTKQEKIELIKEKFTLNLYKYVVRSLLEKDKLIFSLLLCMKILEMERNAITQQEIRFLMIGGTAISAPRANPSSGWLSDKQWGNIVLLSQQIDVFNGFDADFEKEITVWEQIYNSNTPYLPIEANWPQKWREISLFHQLLIIRILRQDKLLPAIQNVISKEMNSSFIEVPPFDLQSAFDDSNHCTPIIFILSPGADPRAEVQLLAEKMNFKANLIDRSLGQGQGDYARQDIELGGKEGKWIFLQNCHLAPSWMGELEKIFESIPENPTGNEFNREFRLWLTSMPSNTFPVSILQKGIKLTYEPPKGLKNNLMRCYYGIENKKFEECNKLPEWKKLLFSLSFFHALVLERRKFGPLGWNIPYGFSQTDLVISVSQLKMLLNENEEIPWSALKYMVAEANYGGRVTDDKDRRLISTILESFYTEKVLDDEYRFSESGIYYAPQEGNLHSYIEYIQQLPLNDTPEVFGMHENAEITGAILDTNQLCNVILTLLPRTTGGEGSKPEDQIKAKCQEILDQLPPLFNLEEVSKTHPVKYQNSMNTVLQQELIRFNKLLSIIQSSLSNLQKAIDGLVTMSNDLDEVFNKMFDNQIPALWQKFSYPSLKPLGSYIKDFSERLQFMQKWADEGVPTTFWISGFYFTQSFLTGTLQNYARKYKIPIDTLQFEFKMIDKNSTEYDLTKSPEDGCYVYGLFLDGARWDLDKNILAEPFSKQLQCEMPYIWLIPNEQSKIDQEAKYDCPVYKTSERRGVLSTTGHSTNFVLNILLTLEAGQPPAHWIKRGVALLTQLDD